jgi:hypothetical protein
MSCDFKPGDEVVCVSKGEHPDWRFLTVGGVYTVSRVYPPVPECGCDEWGIDLAEVPVSDPLEFDGNGQFWMAQGFLATRFRKVQRRDLTAWLSTSVGNTDKLDRPLKAPKRERVS